jgi:hypothetical protein
MADLAGGSANVLPDKKPACEVGELTFERLMPVTISGFYGK